METIITKYWKDGILINTRILQISREEKINICNKKDVIEKTIFKSRKPKKISKFLQEKGVQEEHYFDGHQFMIALKKIRYPYFVHSSDSQILVQWIPPNGSKEGTGGILRVYVKDKKLFNNGHDACDSNVDRLLTFLELMSLLEDPKTPS